MCGDDWFFFFCLGALGGTACFYWLWRAYRRYRLISDTPTSRLRSAAQGYVELAGTCEPFEKQSIQGRLTGRACVWYRYEIAKYVRSGKNSHWKTIERGASDALFTLRDQTGRCYVDPEGAEVHALHDNVWYGHRREPEEGPPARRQIALVRGRYRYTEHRLHARDPLYALGYFETIRPEALERGAGALLRDVISEWKQQYDRLLERFDADGDGELSLQEWERVRAEAQVEAARRYGELQAAPDVNVLVRPPSGFPYVLSSHGEEGASKRYLGQAILSLVGFFALGALATVLGTECLLPALRSG